MSKLLMIATAVVELGAGLALLIAPSLVVELLFDEGLLLPQTIGLAWIAGAALIAIGVACWLTRNAEPSGHQGLVGGLLVYNLAVPALLIRAAITLGISGIAFWPACVLHIGLAIWCVLCLRRR